MEQISPNFIALIGIFIGLLGSVIGVYVTLNNKVSNMHTSLSEHLKHYADDKLIAQKNSDQSRSDLKEFQQEFKKDFKHLEGTVGQMQTNIRVFIGESSEKTNERIHQVEKAFLQQIKEVHDRIDVVKEDVHSHKHEIHEKIIVHLTGQ